MFLFNGSIYKGLNAANGMSKNELVNPETLKNCFGTKEYSDHSGICCNCKLKKACGELKRKNSEYVDEK